MRTSFAAGIGLVDRAEWNALALNGNPFLRHEFLAALETEHCADPRTGWQPCHLVVRNAAGRLAAAMPLYLKTHSWGEFVFDWSWANAFARAGIDYYPKLVSAVPFTPAPGPRLLLGEHCDAMRTRALMIAALTERVARDGLSSMHVLFTQEADRESLTAAGFLVRKDCQFHWHNRGYGSFEDFLATLRADKRKKLRRERRRVTEEGIRFETLHGASLAAADWREIHALTAGTFHRHGHEHYLTAGFLASVARACPEAVMVKIGRLGDLAVAAALFFVGRDALYGRYWGALADFHSLHFEACYYQGIDFCIERGLARFEPGTQGEHKIARGFEPIATWSSHWVADARFARAIASYLRQESTAIDAYMTEVRRHLPFHRDVPGDACGPSSG
jgi:uncharacterized protein